MAVIVTIQEAEISEPQFEASKNKVDVRPYLKANSSKQTGARGLRGTAHA
jgi:hypothetical protein